jgi:pectate lyase
MGKMVSRRVWLTAVGVCLCLGAMAAATEPTVVGWASVNAMGQNGTTGGAGGPTVTVTTATQLMSNMAAVGPRIILVKGTISMGQQEVQSDKTIIGIGTSPTIIGGFKLIGKHNVIIRNLIIKQSSYDGITLEDQSHHVWIDHCDLSNCPDGLLDITHGSDYITVSWCRFSNHTKTCLLGHDDSNGAEDTGHLRVTYHHNWFNATTTRHPRVRFSALTHVYNNYYLNNYYGVASTCEAKVLVEGCYFSGVQYPLLVGYELSPDGDLAERNNIYVGSTLIQTRGTVPEPSAFYAYTLDAAADVPAIVTAGSGLQTTDYLADNEKPRPDPTTWQMAPQALGASAVMMTAAMASDGSGVEYYFTCTSGGGHDSGWQSQAFYVDAGLAAETTCTYTVTARDCSTAHNQTAASAAASATTAAAWSVPQIKVNFQPADITPPDGYLPDSGLVFGARQGNLWYGWNAVHTDTTFIRGAGSDLRRDTVTQVHAGGYWEITVPNGTYDVQVGIGDWTASGNTIVVEGLSYWNNYVLGAGTFDSLTRTVTVADNRLTISVGMASERATHIDYVIITPVSVQVDMVAPLPSPLQWQSPPAAVNGTTITMVASPAVDDGGLEYYFANVTAPARDSGWQSGSTFTDSGLARGTAYTFRVRARDKTFFHNTGDWSEAAPASTLNFDCYLVPVGDFNGSCHVDFADWAYVASAWAGERPPTELTNDGIFDLRDVARFMENWLICNRWPQTECWK